MRKAHANFDSTCPICLEAMSESREVAWSLQSPNCCHVFHNDCIQKWLASSHDDCPCCRGNFCNINVVDLTPSSRRNMNASIENSISLRFLGHKNEAQFCVKHGLIVNPS
jgi:hypothetical protein